MSERAEPLNPATAPRAERAGWRAVLGKEDWLAIWIGLGFVLAGIVLYATGGSLRWIAVAPQKWHDVAEVSGQLLEAAPRYAALFGLLAVVFGGGAVALGFRFRRFLAGFVPLFGVAGILYFIGQWDQAARYNLEPPLVALALGLTVSNGIGVPRWAEAALRVEFYIKIGIVLLGAGVPVALIAWAGPVAIVQAGIVSLVTFATIYLVATRLGLDRRFAATLGTGGAVCGVSGAIATAGAVGARREDTSVAISIVILWAIATIFLLPLLSKSLGLSTGVAGAWIGTSEFADAAGLAAAQAYAGYAGHVPGIAGAPDAAVQAFTLMKVIGRDVWIGIWAFVLAIVATTRWESTGVAAPVDARTIWNRFPKFVLGFVVASVFVSIVAAGAAYADYKKVVQPGLVAPLQVLRVWTFTLAFLSIGLTTRFRDLARAGARPLVAFSTGVAVNLVLGYVLSTQVFGTYWDRLGQ
ncbi:MAG: putative sulfate exporter family transporter [Proteobacteria bacterium]|nr:putative sulfate exporter family transporter [Pseudomonadota bacterium]